MYEHLIQVVLILTEIVILF